jgi:glycerate kinase
LLEGCPIVAPRTSIPGQLLLACAGLGPRLPADRVIAALAAGIEERGMPAPEGCPLPDSAARGSEAQALLERLAFDPRMRAARAVVIGVEQLLESSLAGSIAFEIATRARQAGVPCYAVVRENRLNGFDQRVLDLQRVIEADGPPALRRAGRTLAELA